MSDVEVAGNSSVKWSVVHEDKDGTKPIPHKKPHPYQVEAVDDVDFTEMGVRVGAPAGHFKVSINYEYPADAQAARNSVMVQGSSLVLFVKAVDRTNDQNQNVPSEISISW
jgi:hypothetical protein